MSPPGGVPVFTRRDHRMMRDEMLHLFDTLTADDQAFMLRLLEAKIRSNQSPLVFIEEMMSYQYRGQEDDQYVHTMEVRPEISNRYGMLHGGILSTFIDTAMGATCFVVNGHSTKTVTLDLQVRFLKEAKNGTLTCKTRLQKNGRSTAVLESHVYDGDGHMIGSATGTFFKIPTA
jgi:acyl-CoA thioesterase